jgi:hypothetical protein
VRLLAVLLFLGIAVAGQPQQIVFQSPSLAQVVGWVESVRGQDALVIGDLPHPEFARVLPSRTRVLVGASLPAWVRTGMEVRHLAGLRGRGMLLIDRRFFVVVDPRRNLWTVLASPEVGAKIGFYLEQLWDKGRRL